MSMAHTADQTTARRASATQPRADRSEAIANYLTPERLQRWSHAATVLIAGLLISLAVVEPASAQAASGG